MSRLPIFITGNQHKADYVSNMLGIELEHQKVELDEIQSADPVAVVEHKVRQAYNLLQRPVLVEDTSMGLDDLGGLPGPFIKFFIEQEGGGEKVCRMADGLASRRATATVIFGYFDGERLEFMQNKSYGVIAQHPGELRSGFGWDTVFIQDGYDGVIRSELSESAYEDLYRAAKPFAAVRDFLHSLA